MSQQTRPRTSFEVAEIAVKAALYRRITVQFRVLAKINDNYSSQTSRGH